MISLLNHLSQVFVDPSNLLSLFFRYTFIPKSDNKLYMCMRSMKTICRLCLIISLCAEPLVICVCFSRQEERNGETKAGSNYAQFIIQRCRMAHPRHKAHEINVGKLFPTYESILAHFKWRFCKCTSILFLFRGGTKANLHC
jgi:hypothetical protein